MRPIIVGLLALTWAVVFLVARAGFAPVSEAGHCDVDHTTYLDGWAHQPYTSDLQDFLTRAGNGNLYSSEGYPWALSQVEKGNRTSGRPLVAPFVPPTILKAAAYVESSWRQADYDTARGVSGPILVSPDCGYGVMQITAALVWSMDNGTATEPERLVAKNYGRNVAAGAQVMVAKWNDAPQYRPIVGDGNPNYLEDWYYAIWSYNGFSSVNDPNGFSSSRPEYKCDGVNYTAVPYQERVIGCVRNPAEGLWNAIQMSYRRTLPAFTGCSGSCNTSSMDIPTPTPIHTEGGGGGGDTTPPVVVARRTYDGNSNGHLDGIIVSFNEVVNDQFGGVRFDVPGYCDGDGSTPQPACGYKANGSGNASILVTFPQKEAGDTDEQPFVRMVSNSTLGDGAGNKVHVDSFGNRAADAAGPAIIKAQTVADNLVQLTFSEVIKTSSVRKDDFKLVIRGLNRQILRVYKVGSGADTRYWRIKVSDDWTKGATGKVNLRGRDVIVDVSPLQIGNDQTWEKAVIAGY